MQAQDFRIQYDSISRLLVLPKSHTPHTLVIVSLDPPIRRGQTFYNHLLCQFNNDDDSAITLNIEDAALAAKNAQVRLHSFLGDESVGVRPLHTPT